MPTIVEPTGHGRLRNAATTLIRLRGDTDIAAAHRHVSYRPADVPEASAQPDRRTDPTTHQRIQDFARP